MSRAGGRDVLDDARVRTARILCAGRMCARRRFSKASISITVLPVNGMAEIRNIILIYQLYHVEYYRNYCQRLGSYYQWYEESLMKFESLLWYDGIAFIF